MENLKFVEEFNKFVRIPLDSLDVTGLKLDFKNLKFVGEILQVRGNFVGFVGLKLDFKNLKFVGEILQVRGNFVGLIGPAGCRVTAAL